MTLNASSAERFETEHLERFLFSFKLRGKEQVAAVSISTGHALFNVFPVHNDEVLQCGGSDQGNSFGGQWRTLEPFQVAEMLAYALSIRWLLDHKLEQCCNFLVNISEVCPHKVHDWEDEKVKEHCYQHVRQQQLNRVPGEFRVD